MDPLALDDHGTHQEKAAQMLRTLLNEAFDGSEEQLALALGKPVEDIHTLLGTSGEFDSDLVLKIRGIALNRGVEIEDGQPSQEVNNMAQDNEQNTANDQSSDAENTQSGTLGTEAGNNPQPDSLEEGDNSTTFAQHAAVAGSASSEPGAFGIENDQREKSLRPAEDDLKQG